jgi:hypothetical protein
MALEHVAQGQARFMTPGVAPDPRGILLGRYAVMLFPTLEGVVSWLRMYSSEASLDELASGLAIQRVRTPLASRELVMRIPAVSSYTCDRASRLAKLVGGSTFTGTAKHFVKYRDDRSPYGYDAVDIGALPAGADFVLHGDELSQSYKLEGEIALATLVFRLSVRQVPGAKRLSPEDRAELLLAVQRGLGDGIIRYLWLNRIDAEVALVSPRSASAFEEQGRSYLLFRVRNLPDRILELFLGTPGVDVFRPVSSGAAVAVGWAHPIDLASCASVFPPDTFHLFFSGDRVDALPGPLQLSRIADLTRIDLALEKPNDPQPREAKPADPVAVPLRLAPALGPPRRVTGALIPLAQAAWLKRIVFLLPPPSLRGHRLAVTDRGIVVVGSEGVDVIPLGQLLCELTPGLLVPLGMDVVPRVSPDVLAKSLGHGAGVLTVLPAGAPPFQIAETALVPLERRAIAKIEVERATATDASADATGDPDLVNDPVGRFALWGFPAPADTKLLPAGDKSEK